MISAPILCRARTWGKVGEHLHGALSRWPLLFETSNQDERSRVADLRRCPCWAGAVLEGHAQLFVSRWMR